MKGIGLSLMDIHTLAGPVVESRTKQNAAQLDNIGASRNGAEPSNSYGGNSA